MLFPEPHMRLVAGMSTGGRSDLAKSTAAFEGHASARLFVEAVRKIGGPVTGETVRTAHKPVDRSSWVTLKSDMGHRNMRDRSTWTLESSATLDGC